MSDASQAAKDVFALVAAAMLVFVLMDVDGSVWHDNRRVSPYYAGLLLKCLRGEGFTTNRTIVACTVTEVSTKEN